MASKVFTCYREGPGETETLDEEGKVADENLKLVKLKIEHRVWKRVKDKGEIDNEEYCQG